MKMLVAAMTSAAALCAAATSLAADLPATAQYVPPPAPVAYDWTGFYAGLNAGIAWLGEDITAFPDFGPPFAASESDTGFTFGGQVGYNHQIDNLVLGVEADLNYLDAGSDLTFAGKSTTSWDSDYDWFATIRARAGFASDETLFYATGGVAFLGGDFDIASAGFAAGSASDDETLLGYAIGGGVEHAFSPEWSGKIEYLYADFESHTISDGVAAVKTRPDLHVLRIGVNYHF